MSNANNEIRSRIRNSGLFYWEVADAVGITDSRFSCWLRKPLQGERLSRVLAAIGRLEGGRAVETP